MPTEIEFSKYLKLDVNGRQYLATRQPEVRKAWASLSPREKVGQKTLALIRTIDEIQTTHRRLSQASTK